MFHISMLNLCRWRDGQLLSQRASHERNMGPTVHHHHHHHHRHSCCVYLRGRLGRDVMMTTTTTIVGSMPPHGVCNVLREEQCQQYTEGAHDGGTFCLSVCLSLSVCVSTALRFALPEIPKHTHNTHKRERENRIRAYVMSFLQNLPVYNKDNFRSLQRYGHSGLAVVRTIITIVIVVMNIINDKSTMINHHFLCRYTILR